MQCGVSLFLFPSPLRCWSRLGTYDSADVQILLERNRKKRRRKSAKQLKSLNHHCPLLPLPFFSSSFLPVPLAFSLLDLGEGIGYFSAFFSISSSSLHLCFLVPPVQSTCSCCSVDFSAWVRYAEGLDRRGRRESSRGLARSTVSVPLLSARMEYMFTYRKMRDGNQEGEREKRLLRERVCVLFPPPIVSPKFLAPSLHLIPSIYFMILVGHAIHGPQHTFHPDLLSWSLPTLKLPLPEKSRTMI
ncbi:hypothetical protein BDP67DRAFT_206464 [Colletotrichum lupini]|nr:hypothetical protein BDP67DRAFT_206464 [Colletotrichum lupini]